MCMRIDKSWNSSLTTTVNYFIGGNRQAGTYLFDVFVFYINIGSNAIQFYPFNQQLPIMGGVLFFILSARIRASKPSFLSRFTAA